MYCVVVTGVAGSGKSIVASALAARLGLRHLDADAVHSDSNVAKMSSGTPLTDADRWPWLAQLRAELRGGDLILSCSALTRRYRDALRSAGDVVFVHLVVDADTARQRAADRSGHFMGVDMIDSQFAALEPPEEDETDVMAVDAAASINVVIEAAAAAIGSLRPGTSAVPFISDGEPSRRITAHELAAHLRSLTAEILERGAQRVLLVPPDHTRLHGRAGPITVALLNALEEAGCEVGLLPALGTHVAMTANDARLLFGDGITAERLLVHRWRDGLRQLGEISADEVSVLSQGRFNEPIPVALDEQLFDGWDLVVSIGQVLPHEVIGMANFTKAIVIGLGGAPTIHRSHFLGAISDMESLMGRATSPVRDAVDAAFDRFVAPLLDVCWVLTVMESCDDGAVTQRGLYVGFGRSSSSGGAAFRAAADLSATVNIHHVAVPFERVACSLDPEEFRTTWLGNKAIYRTRMAIADGGELIVLAPGVHRFGEDEQIDALIRRYGYRGTPATFAAVASNPVLADNLGAAAHLVHGSSEGRFRITYCTDPANGGLTRDEVESVGYAWRPLRDELALLGIDGSTSSGFHVDAQGTSFQYIPNPALGLWSARPVGTSV